MAAKDPEKITGKDWEAEVGSRSFKREGIRNEFYDKLARLKLHVETSPDGVLDDPAASGLKTFEELQSAPEFSREVNKGWTLVECLHSYFKNNVGITDAKLRSREVALTLYHLTQQKDTSGRSINVDYLNAKWKVEIKGGQLFIYDQKGEPIVDGANVRKPGTSPAAPALTPTALGTESERFLARVRERSKNTGALDKKITHVREGLTVAKQKIDGMIDTAPPEQIAATSNAWVAWSKDGVLEGDANADLRKTLQGYLGAGNREPRQLWRTEMASYISSKLQTSSRTDKSDVMERVMGAQIVTEFEDDPNEALKTSMNLDEKIKKLSVRKDIAQKMAKSDTSGGLNNIGTLFSGYSVKEVKIVVGGEFMALPIDQAEKFTFMRMVLDEKENRIYAQMQNGCRGNLVVMEVLPGAVSPPAPVAPAPAPAPGVGPGRPRVAPPPTPSAAPPPSPGIGPGKPPVAPPPGPVGPAKPKAAPPGAVPPAAPSAAPAPAPLPSPGVGPGRPAVAPPIAPPSAPLPAPGVGPGKPKPAQAAPAAAPPPAPLPGPVGPAKPKAAPSPAPPPAPPVAPLPGPVGPAKPKAAPSPAPGVGPGKPPAAPPIAPQSAPLPAPGVGPGKPKPAPAAPAAAPPPAPLPGPVGPAKPKPAVAAPPPAPPVAPLPGPVGPAKPKAAPKPAPPPAPPVAPLPGPVGPAKPKAAPSPAPGVGPGKPPAAPPIAPQSAPLPSPGVGPGKPEVAPPPAAGVGPTKPKAAPPGAVPPPPRAEPDEGKPARPPQ